MNWITRLMQPKPDNRIIQEIDQKVAELQAIDEYSKTNKAQIQSGLKDILEQLRTLAETERRELAVRLYWEYEEISATLIMEISGLTKKDIEGKPVRIYCHKCGVDTGKPKIFKSRTEYQNSRRRGKHGDKALCQQCQEQQDAEWKQTSAEQREAQRREDLRIITGKTKATPAAKYYALCQLMSKEQSEKLRDMPYQQFLDTYFWKVIRGYKLYKAKYICFFCNASATLDVHHRTYEHHGCEHDYLDDLVVLCRNCHAKFHDKLIQNERGL